MSRFDDFAKSSARGRGFLRQFACSDAESVESGISRRDLMKKAGIVGGVAASAGLIETVVTPGIAAASPNCSPSDPNATCGGTCTNKCGPGQICGSSADCASPGVCQANKCVTVSGQALGAPCVGDTQQQKDASCATGYCGGAGTCAAPTPTGGLASTCHGATQTAADANCLTTMRCAGYVVGGTASGTCKKRQNETCQNDAECASNNCELTDLGVGRVCAA